MSPDGAVSESPPHPRQTKGGRTSGARLVLVWHIGPDSFGEDSRRFASPGHFSDIGCLAVAGPLAEPPPPSWAGPRGPEQPLTNFSARP